MTKKQEKMQQNMVQFQMLQARHQMLRKNMEALVQQLQGISQTKQTIEDLGSVKPNTTLVDIGNGNFVQGKIEDSSELIVSIGAGIAIKKSRKDTLKITEGRIKEMEKTMKGMEKEEQKVVHELRMLQPILQQEMQEQQSKK